MRAIFGLVAALLLALPVAAEEPADSIQAVIADQIAAFGRADVEAAYAHASPVIQRKFGSAGRFGQMVEGGYPMIWRPSTWRMLELEDRSGSLFQTVLFADQAGELYEADYEMIEIDGIWRINGVMVRKLPTQSS
ncbi:MAG: DUF4864 domain-containing protein [Pseudomonadota bacterium]